ncbi:hypothetical protein GCM10009609_56150 [Pseudonocardia aurantiaca]|uniref:DUF397 domain-containing protein n=1 Tax=Pseudonocardia aurantiaca TaxID=75290 RepID=A0ABW4FYC2_9PSEU
MSSPDELAGAVWRRSSTSADDDHGVEVAVLPGPRWAVRDSRSPEGPVLIFTEAEWVAFSLGARAGEFDFAGDAEGGSPER